ncbi:MAG: hypothetical protein AB1805_16745 [Nitrospirota bacterium]
MTWLPTYHRGMVQQADTEQRLRQAGTGQHLQQADTGQHLQQAGTEQHLQQAGTEHRRLQPADMGHRRRLRQRAAMANRYGSTEIRWLNG